MLPHSRIGLVAGFVIAGLALAGDPKPKKDLACKVAADCGVTHYNDDCCIVCSWTPAAKRSIAALTAWCHANPNPKCPPFDCPPMDPTVECGNGRCAMKTK